MIKKEGSQQQSQHDAHFDEISSINTGILNLEEEILHFEGMTESLLQQSLLQERYHQLSTLRKEREMLIQKSFDATSLPKINQTKNEGDVYSSAQPPVLAELLTRITTKSDIVGMVIDSRAERFAIDLQKHGTFRAKLLYWADTAKSCWPSVRRLVEWVAAGEVFRRWLGS